MTDIEYLDEFMEEEIFVDDQSTNYIKKEPLKTEKEIFDENENELFDFSQPGTSTATDDQPVKKPLKRKIRQLTVKKPATTNKPRKDSTSKGTMIKLYAYKDCLGKYDSLIKNPEMPLWLKDGSCLLQKYLRHQCNDDGLFYYSTQIYSCWEDERADEYLELDAEITVRKNNIDFIVKIHNIDEVENVCLNGHYKELGLQPYTHFQGRAADNIKYDDARSFTIHHVQASDASTENDDTSYNDVIESIEDIEA